MQTRTFETTYAGRSLKAEFTDLAENAHGSVMLRYGDTLLLATACMSKNAKESGEFFPLTVDYEERFYAAGEILGSEYKRRENSNDQTVLHGRVVDRTIRPLFDGRMRNEVQVIITALSLGDDYPDSLAVIASSLALAVSPIPWNGPVGSVRVAHKGQSWTMMPGRTKRHEYDAMLTVCGKGGDVNMIEMDGVELSEDAIMEALLLATEEISRIEKWQREIVSVIGKEKKHLILPEIPADIVLLFEEHIRPRFVDALFTHGAGRKHEYALLEEWMALVSSHHGMNKGLAAAHFDEEVNNIIHKRAIEEGVRADGRGMDEVRSLFVQAGGVSDIHHGSGIFYRGGTHVLSVVTLGGPKDTLEVENSEVQEGVRYWHHYNFPPFSSGELGRSGQINRRAIGHGKLAEKALLAVLPSSEKFPYTIRVVSEALSSNGSTSMASVCGSTLALMDAGVPIASPVAGIASGLMMESDGRYKLLTDIQGPEDHHGDMDFKVAGTKDGITAVQMDVKVDGVPLHILRAAFEKAKTARLHVLDVMNTAIAAPRSNLKSSAPEILTRKIRVDQIRTVIGSGGKVVQEIRAKTGASVEVEDDGTVFTIGKNGSAKKAMMMIDDLVFEYTLGDTLEGRVSRITDFGCFVDLERGRDGMVHVSELAPWHVVKPSDLVAVGDILPVVVTKIDERGRIDLSVKRCNDHMFDEKKQAMEQSTPVAIRRSESPAEHIVDNKNQGE